MFLTLILNDFTAKFTKVSEAGTPVKEIICNLNYWMKLKRQACSLEL
jgi:hypothetical protein